MVGAESLKHLGSYHLNYENTKSYPFSSLKFVWGVQTQLPYRIPYNNRILCSIESL